MDLETSQRIVDLKNRLCPKFTFSDWEEIAFLTGTHDQVTGHPRLLRSLRFGDDDYEGCVLSVLRTLWECDPQHIHTVESYLAKKYPEAGAEQYVSARPATRKLTFSPGVFDVPEFEVENDLVAIMMPFEAGFDGVYTAIKGACQDARRRCLRADDI